MCGILAALGVTGNAEENRRDVLRRSRLLRHRGPDQNAVYQAPDGRAFLAFERLMIVDPTDNGRRVLGRCTCPASLLQPFQIPTPEGNIAWALYVKGEAGLQISVVSKAHIVHVNSEIYNHMDIRRTKLDDADLGSKSDSAIIGHLYARHGDTNE
ncbi:hypothetical protein H632_c3756p0, partial [Helicosporidium sp. ATCC 50920]